VAARDGRADTSCGGTCTPFESCLPVSLILLLAVDRNPCFFFGSPNCYDRGLSPPSCQVDGGVAKCICPSFTDFPLDHGVI
jgi:hypothetical protein